MAARCRISGMARPAIPHATVSRLPLYLRCLDQLPVVQETDSSGESAAAISLYADKERKELW
ncbi:MAG: redox-sensing transcriptional repressor Rex, partial [Acidimicrobiia bacterium]|nr:redox-sensing transcriptional repressor Rex [Acidimicrobiia bacterium]